jgi:uncharacterized protein (DUF433 family)
MSILKDRTLIGEPCRTQRAVRGDVLGISRVHKVETQNIRAALQDKRNSHGLHALASRALLTEDIQLLARDLGGVGNRFKPTEQNLVDVISAYRKRIEWEDNEPAVLFPFPTANAVEGRKSVMIDPRISFGRRVISGTGIVIEIVAERFHAGESIDDLAKDYRRDRLEIEGVLRFEPALAA